VRTNRGCSRLRGIRLVYGFQSHLENFNLAGHQMTTSKRPSYFISAAPLAMLILALFKTGPGYAAISCSSINGETHCVCHGDDECNDMFANYCKAGSGSCDNGHGACECTIRASHVPTARPSRHPILTPPRGRPVGGRPVGAGPVISKTITQPPSQTILEKESGGDHGKH
jgi:hypothetical protein